jgi:AraC-like DNA-binding protein
VAQESSAASGLERAPCGTRCEACPPPTEEPLDETLASSANPGRRSQPPSRAALESRRMEMPSGSMIAPLAGALVHELMQRGGQPGPILGALGVDDIGQLLDPERRVAGSAVFAAWEVAMRVTRDDGLPIAVGRHASVQRFGVLGYALYTSPTVGDAFRSLVRYHDVINTTGRFVMTDHGSRVKVAWVRADGSLGQRVANEQVLASFITFSTEVFGARAADAIMAVHVAHPPPRKLALHDAHFPCALRWEANENAVELDAQVMLGKPRAGDPLIGTYFGGLVEEALTRVAPADSWSARVAEAVSNRLASGLPTLAMVAKELGSSERTARRRLAGERTSFAEITQRVQRERAARMLAKSLPIRDIAFALGFADVTAFCRAYRRWTGRAPSEDRGCPPSPSAPSDNRRSSGPGE